MYNKMSAVAMSRLCAIDLDILQCKRTRRVLAVYNKYSSQIIQSTRNDLTVTVLALFVNIYCIDFSSD